LPAPSRITPDAAQSHRPRRRTYQDGFASAFSLKTVPFDRVGSAESAPFCQEQLQRIGAVASAREGVQDRHGPSGVIAKTVPQP
jgi:hypothetical protein